MVHAPLYAVAHMYPIMLISALRLAPFTESRQEGRMQL